MLSSCTNVHNRRVFNLRSLEIMLYLFNMVEGIREFKKEDQLEVKKFVLDILAEFKFPYNRELDYDLENPDKYYKDQGGIFYILEVDNKIVGTIAVKNKGDSIAEIKRLYIDRNHRGKGYGSKLFDKALKFCKDNNFTKVILDTWTRFETAKLLYLSRGFKITRTHGEQIFMEKEI